MDRTGKDTFIKSIVNHYPDQTFHTLHYHNVKTRPAKLAKPLAVQTYREMLEFLTAAHNINFVLNRSHYGEHVYGPLYRDYDGMFVFALERSPEYQAFLDDASLIILTHNDLDTLRAREDGDSLSQGREDLIAKERDLFYDVFMLSAIHRKILLPVDGLTKEQVTNRLTSWLDVVYNDSTTQTNH